MNITSINNGIIVIRDDAAEDLSQSPFISKIKIEPTKTNDVVDERTLRDRIIHILFRAVAKMSSPSSILARVKM